MKTIARNIPFTFSGLRYQCDVVLAMYVQDHAPALLLVDSAGEAPGPVAKGSLLPPSGVLASFPFGCFAVKDYSENEGFAEQLLLAVDEAGNPICAPYLRDGREARIAVGHVTVPIFQLKGSALAAFSEMYENFSGGKK